MSHTSDHKHHAVLVDGSLRIITETPRKVEAMGRSAISRSGKPGASRHRDMQDLLRAKFTQKGYTVEALFDTLDDARTKAVNYKGSPDHRVRIEAVKVTANLLGLTGSSALAAVEEENAESAQIMPVDLRGRSDAEIIEAVMRKTQLAQSQGDEADSVNPEHVKKLSQFSMAAIGVHEEVAMPITVRPNSKVSKSKLGLGEDEEDEWNTPLGD